MNETDRKFKYALAKLGGTAHTNTVGSLIEGLFKASRAGEDIRGLVLPLLRRVYDEGADGDAWEYSETLNVTINLLVESMGHLAPLPPEVIDQWREYFGDSPMDPHQP